MPTEYEPIVNRWYRHLDKGYQFQVVAVDKEAGAVEIQHFDGDLEELDLDTWHDMYLEPIEPPEDWTGPIDDVERDDLGYTETDMRGEDWSGPLKDGPAPLRQEEGEEGEGEEEEQG